MTERSGTLLVNRVDIDNRSVRAGELAWRAGVITGWHDLGGENPALPYVAPGFVDAHVHLESSLLPPSEFARLAVRHGTVAAVSDPHEIANVLGVAGVHWMLDNIASTPFHVLLGAPSCVPATPFESAGALLNAVEVESLLDTPGIGYLSEVMNFPGVLSGEPELMAKLAAALLRNLPIDGHAPGLIGKAAVAYAQAGIGTDHECSTLVEAEDKIHAGMRILIREGSAARNFEALHPLIGRYPGQVMLCTDDCHPDDLVRGHINRLVARAVAHGHDLFSVLRAACLTPQEYYGLGLGQLRPGDPMNAVLLADLRDFTALATWLDGVCVADNGQSRLPKLACAPVNRFAAAEARAEDLRIPAPAGANFVLCRVIAAEDGQLLTRALALPMRCRDGFVEVSVADDVLLLAVINRYRPAPPAVALIHGFGLKSGALASSVAHDSHNVIGIGCDAASLADAMNTVIRRHGGLAVAHSGKTDILPLPLAGLMSDEDGDVVATRYAALTESVRSGLGSLMRAPFMTLSFMALLVIPEIKLSDRGLFDGVHFAFTEPVIRFG